MKKNLPSITARPVEPGSERSGAKSTTKMTEDTMATPLYSIFVIIKSGCQFKTTEGRASPLPYAKRIMGQGSGGGATGLNQDSGK